MAAHPSGKGYYLVARDGTIPEATLSRTIITKVMRDRVAMLADDARYDSRLDGAGSIQAMVNIRSFMCAPLWNRNEVIGVLYTDNPKSKRYKYSSEVGYVDTPVPPHPPPVRPGPPRPGRLRRDRGRRWLRLPGAVRAGGVAEDVLQRVRRRAHVEVDADEPGAVLVVVFLAVPGDALAPDDALAILEVTRERQGSVLFTRRDEAELVLHDGVFTWTPEYASRVVRTLFDRSRPAAVFTTDLERGMAGAEAGFIAVGTPSTTSVHRAPA